MSADAELAAQIADLRRAIASGTRKVRSHTNGVEREVEYRSLEDMRSVLADLERSAGIRRPVRPSFISHSRGY